MNGQHAVVLALHQWWAAGHKKRKHLAHNFKFSEILKLWYEGKLVKSGENDMQIQGSMQTYQAKQNGNGNGNGGQRIVMPTGAQQQSSQATRRSTMTDPNVQGQQVVQATITQEDVGKTVPVVIGSAPQAPAVTSQEERFQALEAEMARLKAENRRLQDMRTKGITCKVSDKGAGSVYGLGRFPVTLYKSQWLRLLENIDLIRDFVNNTRELKEKDE